MRSDIWNFSKEVSDNIIFDYNLGTPARQLGFKHKVSPSTIIKYLKINNVFIRNMSNSKRTNQIKEDVFDKINEESAYWIGFILSDGNIYYPKNRSKRLTLCLKESDREHLEKFKTFIGSNKRLYYYDKDNTVYLSVCSNRIVNKLEEYGITERKSLTAKVPEQLKNNKHFWRGVIDGDGSVRFHKTGYPIINLCGTVDVVGSFMNFTGKIIKIYQPDLNKNFGQIGYGATSAKTICEYLYGDSKIYLNRKYENYKRICLWTPKHIKKKSLLCIKLLGG